MTKGRCPPRTPGDEARAAKEQEGLPMADTPNQTTQPLMDRVGMAWLFATCAASILGGVVGAFLR